MPIRDQAAMERSLDNDYGSTRGPNAPDSFEVMLLDSFGVEIDDVSLDEDGITEIPNGYARATHDNDDWLPAAEGVKVSGTVTFPAPTAEWETAVYRALIDPLTNQRWDYAPLADPLDVSGAGSGTPTLVMTVFYDDNLDL